MKKIFFLLSLLAIISCRPENVTTDQVISAFKISNHSPLADGSTIVYLSVQLNGHADADKRSVIFETSSGHFVTSSSIDTVVTQAATFVNGALIATIGLKMPQHPTTIKLTATPAAISQQQTYVVKDSIVVAPSVPAKLVLTPSALSVKTGFKNTMLLTGTLTNASKGNVSTGAKVVFQDVLLNGQPVGGQYLTSRLTTDATSTVTTSYSPGYVAPTTQLYIKCIYLDASGNLTAIRDSCLVTVIP